MSFTVQDILMLVIVVGLLILVGYGVILHQPIPDQLMTALLMVVSFYFGRASNEAVVREMRAQLDRLAQAKYPSPPPKPKD